jgi:hypothetical protein
MNSGSHGEAPLAELEIVAGVRAAVRTSTGRLD